MRMGYYFNEGLTWKKDTSLNMTGYNCEYEKNNTLTSGIRVILNDWISQVMVPMVIIPKYEFHSLF
jgi:hypothetical protein